MRQFFYIRRYNGTARCWNYLTKRGGWASDIKKAETFPTEDDARTKLRGRVGEIIPDQVQP